MSVTRGLGGWRVQFRPSQEASPLVRTNLIWFWLFVALLGLPCSERTLWGPCWKPLNTEFSLVL